MYANAYIKPGFVLVFVPDEQKMFMLNRREDVIDWPEEGKQETVFDRLRIPDIHAFVEFAILIAKMCGLGVRNDGSTPDHYRFVFTEGKVGE
jgi:hypothetical protein